MLLSDGVARGSSRQDTALRGDTCVGGRWKGECADIVVDPPEELQLGCLLPNPWLCVPGPDTVLGIGKQRGCRQEDVSKKP